MYTRIPKHVEVPSDETLEIDVITAQPGDDTRAKVSQEGHAGRRWQYRDDHADSADAVGYPSVSGCERETS